MLKPKLDHLARHGQLALAVSGGRDSTALMLLAAQALPSDQIHVLTVNHGLRPDSAEEAASVKAWSKRLGLSHTTLHWTGDKPGTGIQAAARKARYALMTAWCRQHSVCALLTAHTLDDQAETVLMRLKRGGGVDALSAMAPESWRDGVRLLRPLLDVPRIKLTDFLESEEHPWIDDPSNESTEFERIRLRKRWDAVTQLGLSKEQLAKTSRKMTRARIALDGAATELLARGATISDLGFCTLEPTVIATASLEIQMRALARCLQAVGGAVHPPLDASLETAARWLFVPESPAITLGGCRLAIGGKVVTIAREAGRIKDRSIALPARQEILWDRRFVVSCDSDCGDVLTGPLGTAGWASLRKVRPALPAFVGRGLPAIWKDKELLAVPPLGYVSPNAPQNARFSAVFANRGLVESPGDGQSVTGSS